ncbi:magnesium chelatase subunit D [Planktotalea sp.]|uniref:magnesium chelatase subunit D n=1 Tax=Planktotalea sp. TaxID=2029877 RepID=UPI0025D0CFB4|nr:magnesium chelatase subunit D [Planktotalea sp.]
MLAWDRATLALSLLAIDPRNLGGLVVRARVGPARDALMATVQSLPIPSVRLHPHMTAQVLDGDIDLSATLSGGTLVYQKGILDRPPSLFILPMAERVDPYMSARLSQALDGGHSHAILALDEGADEGEAIPPSLADRAAFHVSLDMLALANIQTVTLPDNLAEIRRAARKVTVPLDTPEDLVQLAVSLGITSLRAPSFALCAAKTHAALNKRDTLIEEDITPAVALVYAHRATRLPESVEPEDQQPETAPDDTPKEDSLSIPKDVLLEAVKTALPPDLLAGLDAGTTKRAKGSGSGAKRKGNRRGRPLPARIGPQSSSARVDLVATLRAAIPYQTLRKRTKPDATGPIFQHSDLRHKRYESKSDRLLIFTVDASGSAAMARLAEAKGAVELLLSEAYARRDHVALISFRGTQAETLLTPTRSLVQTKRRLASIPGGGATPLASGLTAALSLAQSATQKGLTPTIVLLTDGRANVALDGQADRMQAAKDAQNVAVNIAKINVEAIVIDTTIRPEKALKLLSNVMRAKYVPLPRADAKGVSKAVTAALVE